MLLVLPAYKYKTTNTNILIFQTKKQGTLLLNFLSYSKARRFFHTYEKIWRHDASQLKHRFPFSIFSKYHTREILRGVDE